MRIRFFSHESGSGSAGKEVRIQIQIRIRPEIEMKIKIYLYFRKVGIKFDIIINHFMLEVDDSDLYFVQDKNNFINPLLQVGSGSGGPKITGSDRIRIRILIPGLSLF